MDVLVAAILRVPFRTLRFAALGALLAAVPAVPPAQAQLAEDAAHAAPSSRPVSRDETLWREIEALQHGLRSGPSAVVDPDAALRSRRGLLQKTRAYLAAYPGGPRRSAAVQLELETLFEIGTLSGGKYGALRTQVEEYLRHPLGEEALHEAAYWAILCRRLTRHAGQSPPASAPAVGADEDLLAEYRAYLQHYPRSRHVPRMAAKLFDAAEVRNDRDEQRQLVRQLEGAFTEHAVTKLLTARLRRSAAAGLPFSLRFDLADGTRVDTGQWKGDPVLIVVWAGFSEPARACVAAIDDYREHHRELRVVGVNLDGSRQQMRAACQELGLAWPQFNDGLGWANRFAREWGVREVPYVFAVDRAGCLAGSSGAAGWRDLAARVLEN